MADIRKQLWEKSYERFENFILYPKEEVVKFLNRFVRKKTLDGFIDILQSKNNYRGLDLGCGIGRNTILLGEFGLEAYGIDISETAIRYAEKLLTKFIGERGKDKITEIMVNFQIYDGLNIPFKIISLM